MFYFRNLALLRIHRVCCTTVQVPVGDLLSFLMNFLSVFVEYSFQLLGDCANMLSLLFYGLICIVRKS